MRVELTLKDKGKLATALFSRNKKFREIAKRELVYASDDFIELIRKKWYSGRLGDDTGLNKQTHDLYKNWFAEVKESTFDMMIVIRNAMKYGLYHEKGQGQKKRTFVVRDLNETNLFSEAIRQALKEAF